MNDKDRFTVLLESWGFTWAEYGPGEIYSIGPVEYKTKVDEFGNDHVVLGGGSGYSGFFSGFVFNEHGAFLEHYCGE
jgi:hypothetical protein